jgi:hypothetical protein
MKLGDKDIKQIKIAFDVEKQRYNTLGDYLIEDNELVIKISKIGDIYQLVVMIHELVESLLCLLSGVEFQEIDEFDIEYENARERGEKTAPCGCLIQDEPGEDIHAPYNKFHKIAEIFEYLFLQHISNILYEKNLGKEVKKDE